MTEETVTAGRALVFERLLTHPAEKIWRALTDRALVERWLMRNDLDPVPGRAFEFRMDPMPHWDGVVRCEVLESQPHARLSYAWRSLGLDSVVTWTLTPTDGGVLLRLEQSGFPDEDSQSYRGASYGWRSYLDRLEGVLGELG